MLFNCHGMNSTVGSGLLCGDFRFDDEVIDEMAIFSLNCRAVHTLYPAVFLLAVGGSFSKANFSKISSSLGSSLHPVLGSILSPYYRGMVYKQINLSYSCHSFEI